MHTALQTKYFFVSGIHLIIVAVKLQNNINIIQILQITQTGSKGKNLTFA